MEWTEQQQKEEKWAEIARKEKIKADRKTKIKQRVKSSSGIIAKMSIFALGFGLIFVLLDKAFSFPDLMHRILTSNYALFDIQTLIRDIHGLLPDNVGFFTAIEDLAVIVVSLVYVIGWFINILFAILG